MNPGIPQHIAIEGARRERDMLARQRDMAAESIAELSEAAAQLGYVDREKVFKEQSAMLTALNALISVRLLELQFSHSNLDLRVKELEAALRQVDSGLVLPKGQVRVK